MVESVDSVFLVKAAKFVAAGLCMAIGGIGSAIGQGYIGGKCCESIGRNPSCAKDVISSSFFSMLIVETSTVFAFLISLILLFVV